MKRTAFIIILAGGAIAITAWQFAASRSFDAQTTTAVRAVPATNSSPTIQAGYVAHIDESGQLVEEPSAGSIEELNAALEQSISTSSEGLVETPLPGGGVTVDLQGRFQSTSVATRDANGKVTVPCLTNENDLRALTSSPAPKDAGPKE